MKYTICRFNRSLKYRSRYVYLLPKQTTKFGISIPPDERLAITLSCLATGKSYESLCINFKYIKPLFETLFKRFAVIFTKYFNQSI